MLSNSIFYHSITRKIIVGFGSLFSGIKFERKDDTGQVQQTIAVPITYAPKEKWLVRVEQDPTLENHTYTTLPRLSFEITGISYDSSRKTARGGLITCSTQDGMTRTYAPTPYNIEISMYALTKTTEDGLQIAEQILPFFAPELTMAINTVPGMNVVTDIPIILNGVSVNDEYDGDFQTRRFVTWTFNFTLKAQFFGPVSDGTIIKKVFVDVKNFETSNIMNEFDVEGFNDGTFTEQWKDF